MILNRTASLIVTAATLFAPGLVASAQTNTTTVPAHATPAPQHPGSMMETQLKAMSEHLKLTDEQTEKVKVVLRERQHQAMGLRELSPDERNAKMKEIRAETNRKMKDILTPDQYKQWQQMRQHAATNNASKLPAAAAGSSHSTQ